MYAFKCGEDSKNKLKAVSESYSNIIKYKVNKICLNDEKHQKQWGNYILRSLNHEMYLQKINKSSLYIIDDKRCYINETESIPWN